MPHFDIVRKSEVDKTFRIAKLMNEFDVSPDKASEHFTGDIELPDPWNIGLIVGSSGTGKTTIANELFGENLITSFSYTHKSVIDDMPDVPFDEIVKTFYSVGFGSVPSWMKPYSVLSNGEKMRVDFARAILEDKFFVFDEFTSVVDRNVARTMCTAVEKAIRKANRKFVAVSCHRDVIEYLQPDWVFDTDEMKCFFPLARDRREDLRSDDAGETSGESLAVITI